jgi:hypothetical protein
VTKTLTRPRRAAPDLATPPLATCSIGEYRREMGAAVLIAPRPPWAWRPTQAPGRWTDGTRWPVAPFLIPRGYPHWKKRDEPASVLAAAYLRQLERLGPARIANGLRQVPVEGDGRLVLLCYEKGRAVCADPWACHRRMFAAWWEDKTGAPVPELN